MSEWRKEEWKKGKNMKGCHVKWMTCWTTDVNIDFGAVRSCDRLAAPVWLWTNLVAAFPHLPSVEKGITHSEVWRLCLMIFQLTWHLNDFRICCPSVGQPKLWRVFGRPFLPFASENTNPNGPKVTFHRQRIIPRQPLTFEVEIIDASQGLDTAAGTAAQWASPKSYGASFWCQSCIILVCKEMAFVYDMLFALQTCMIAKPAIITDWLFFRESIIGITWYRKE